MESKTSEEERSCEVKPMYCTDTYLFLSSVRCIDQGCPTIVQQYRSKVEALATTLKNEESETCCMRDLLHQRGAGNRYTGSGLKWLGMVSRRILDFSTNPSRNGGAEGVGDDG